MSRKPILAGNWKMNGTTAFTEELTRALVEGIGDVADREVVIAPPFTALAAAARVLSGSPILLAAQNVHWEESGAFTGEISPEMLLDAGCRMAIVGHSERRQHFGETDDTVNARARAAVAAGLRVILCVGETLDEREDGVTADVVSRQTRLALKGLDADAMKVVSIAYEPVWAIGTGKTASPAQAQEVHEQIRNVVREELAGPTAEAVRILYGGSVKPGNVDELMSQADVDGALVGGASLDAESFLRIVSFH